MRGPKERAWSELLRPSSEALRHASYVWIFDPSIAVHPVHNPLAQMVETLRATDASLVYAMVHPHAERYNRNPSPSPNPTLCQTLTLCQALALTPTQVQLLAASGRPLRRAHLSSH